MIQQNPKKFTACESKPTDFRFNWDNLATKLSNGSAPRVLIAEDDPALRDLMARMLAFEGYIVTETADGQTMLEAAHASHDSIDDAFDLIVTDVHMPGMTGLDALARLRELGCCTPAIVVSALPPDMVQYEVHELNALFLPKPFALENLLRIANRVVGGQQSQASDVK